MAYFSKIMSLKEITSHIYGESDEVVRTDRPNMFIKELNIYIDFLKDKLEETKHSINDKQKKYLSVFVKNLKEGVSYYENIFGGIKIAFENSKSQILNDLDNSKTTLNQINSEIDDL